MYIYIMNIPHFMKYSLLLLSFVSVLVAGCGQYKHFTNPVINRDGWWYLFASAGRYNDYSYAIVVGRSRNADGPFLTKDGKDMA